MATTHIDIVTYVMLTIPVLLGGAATLLNQVLGITVPRDDLRLVPIDLPPARRRT